MQSPFFVNITTEDLNVLAAHDFIHDAGHGAMQVFTGSIRQQNNQRQVINVEYEVYKPLAEKLIMEFCHKAVAKYEEGIKIYIVHRSGKLQVGELSVIVAVSTKHRREAMAACSYLIEAIKHQCPIWKKETYIDGETEWVQGHSLCQS